MAYDDVLAALADPTRRGIFESLRSGPRTVGQLAQDQPVTRPAVSQHLKILDEAKLVTVKAEGTRRLYSIRREGLDELRDYVNDFWSDALASYSAEIQRRITNKPGDRPHE